MTKYKFIQAEILQRKIKSTQEIINSLRAASELELVNVEDRCIKFIRNSCQIATVEIPLHIFEVTRGLLLSHYKEELSNFEKQFEEL